MIRLIRDEKGIVAIEAALLFPVMLALILGQVVLTQAFQNRGTAGWIAQACASAAAHVYAANSDFGAAQAKAQAIYDANASLWIMGAKPTFGGVVLNGDGTIACTVTADAVPLAPVPWTSSLHTSATAVD